MQPSQNHLWSSHSLCSQEKVEGGVVDATLLSGGVMSQRLWLLIFLRPLCVGAKRDHGQSYGLSWDANSYVFCKMGQGLKCHRH